jgi:hypothetical protein
MIRRTILLVLFFCLASRVGADPMQSKADVEKIMNAMLPFAEQMLEKHGEFFPYGAAMTQDGEVVAVGSYDSREKPPSQDVINHLKKVLRSGAKAKKYKASAIFFDVRIVPPGTIDKTDAIAIALDHQDNYSVVIYIPYRSQSGKIQLGQAFAAAGTNDVFGK